MSNGNVLFGAFAVLSVGPLLILAFDVYRLPSMTILLDTVSICF